MKKKQFWLSLLVCAILGGGWVTSVSAQDPTPVTDNQVNEVARQLYCPVCENVTLDVCTTAACAQWRDLIREKLGQGWTVDQIKEYFVAQYGDRVLAEPPKHGFNWLAYVMPPAVIIAALVYVIRSMQKMHRSRTASPTADSAAEGSASEEYMAQVEEELRQRRNKS